MPTTVRSKALAVAAGFAAILALGVTSASADTLKSVRDRGKLVCGVNQGLQGFAAKDDGGAWTGFDVDYCRAIAAAVLNDPAKVEFVPLSAAERFDALRSGKIDVLVRNSTWTIDREAGSGILFTGITYHDGQGFLVARHPDIVSARELGGLSVCVQAGTTSQANLVDFFKANTLTFTEVDQPSAAEALAALGKGQCDVLTADQSALFALRLQLPEAVPAVILPDVISKEPLSPAVRSDDVAWFDIVKWTHFALVNAEELGISSVTLEEAAASAKPDVRRFMGADGGFGERLGLTNTWAVQIVKAVGNYSEIYERNLGVKSKLGIPRGLNQLWNLGGIVYAPPLR